VQQVVHSCGYVKEMEAHTAHTNTDYEAAAKFGTGNYENWSGSPVTQYENEVK
jgi:hypothetical protein